MAGRVPAVRVSAFPDYLPGRQVDSPLPAFEVRPRGVVVQQVVRRDAVLGSVAGHQLAGDAVHPGVLVQADLAADVVHLVPPGPPDAGHVEALDRLLLAVVADLADHPQLTPAAAGL